MKFAVFLVLSLSAVALAGPAFNKNNQINMDTTAAYKQHQCAAGPEPKGLAVDILRQWCASSQMSQQELTVSFKKLVQAIKSNPLDQITKEAVMNECICKQPKETQQKPTGDTKQADFAIADAAAHELVKDVYMDALISCNSRECIEQLTSIIQSQQVEPIRAAYYMTRIAMAGDKDGAINDEQTVKQFAEMFIQQQQQQQHEPQSEAIERQKLFATTSLIGKWISQKPQQRAQIVEVAKQVAKVIVEQHIKCVGEHELQQYKQTEQPAQELAKKIAKRNAALKALANIPGHVLKECPEVEETLVRLAEDKQELATVRQSAIECLEQNDKQMQLLKQLTFDQQEPIEVRVAAYRALMTTPYAPAKEAAAKTEQQKEQLAQEIVELCVKHCQSEQNQQQDDQFVLYAVSHLDNVRTSQQQEHQAIKQVIAKNKQHFMQIQVLQKRLQKQLADVRRSSRNYKLEQEFNQIESGLVLEGDLVYESKQQQQQQTAKVLPKLVRVNMSMPIMGQTVNVVEVTLRQNQMDEELLSALKLVQSVKFNSESVAKVVDSFKSSAERVAAGRSKDKPVEADLTIKVDGCTIVYLCVDDFKYAKRDQQHQRSARSVYPASSLVDEALEFLKRQPVAFNRGFNVNVNERLAKVLDVEANIVAGLRFEARAQGHSKDSFEVVAQMEPRVSFEAIVGPAKLSAKKLLQRAATKTALGLRLRFKKDELVDVQLELPMDTMELFTLETQLVEKTKTSGEYSYLAESVYGQTDIYAAQPIYSQEFAGRLAKRSIVPFGQQQKKAGLAQLFKGFYANKSARMSVHTLETPAGVQRATGLDAKLRLAASPKDMTLLVAATLDKVDPQMRGFRVKVEKAASRAGEPKSYLVSVSAPGARGERAMQVRVSQLVGQQRTLVKCDIAGPQVQAGLQLELVHDGRQYAAKAELKSAGPQPWRHAAELGFTTGAQAAAGRLATFNCKPYLQVDSTALKRPVQLQGQLAFVQSPKSVISYELKCATSGAFVQGKLIFDQRDKQPMAHMKRRAMRSPVELALAKDLTLTHELIGQVEEHAVKVHNMLDWDCQKFAFQGDAFATYKNLRKAAAESRLAATMKVEPEQQVFTVERKCAADERKSFAARLVSSVRPAGHQMEAECRFPAAALVAYKHKVEVQRVGPNKYDAQVELELVDSARAVSEKLAGRVRLASERKTKQIQVELAAGAQKSLKLAASLDALAQLQIQLAVAAGQRFQHKTEVRNSRAQFSLQSRTERPAEQKVWLKVQAEAHKPSGECKLALEAPAQRASLAADLKLASGKRSSVALQTGRFASQAEFSFELVPAARAYLSRFNPFERAANLRLRSQLKDLAAKRAYWVDSAVNVDKEAEQASFVRLDSPIYRTELEFSPRAQEAKLAAFARAKRSVDQFESIYAKDLAAADMLESAFERAADKLQLSPAKVWMVRSVVGSPLARAQLKQRALRALFEFADQRQQHRHSFEYAPEADRLQMELAREPTAGAALAPMRLKADLNTRIQGRPSTMSLDSEWVRADVEAKPCASLFGAEAGECGDSYAKLSALARHPRAAFHKHDSEIRHKRDQGYKAWVRHEDAQAKRHELRLEADEQPRKWAKLQLDSDKHGKAGWEHKWRKQQHKDQDQDVYLNEMRLSGEGPAANKWQHETALKWQEPVARELARGRRSAADDSAAGQFLKATSARLSSQMQRAYASEPAYKLDFDFQPQANLAQLELDMPAQALKHFSQLELKPAERLYKFQSKLFDRRTQEPTFELTAATKAGGEQEPVFVHSSHPMLERPVDGQSLVYKLLRQPLKLDYSDKWGRAAGLDYDQLAGAMQPAQGLRQKRAAVHLKHAGRDFEQRASLDFYPETLLATPTKAYYAGLQRDMAPVAFKTHTKFGPVVVRAHSSEQTCMLDVQSPLASASLTGETGANMQKLFKVQLDNKAQRVQLAKLVRECMPEAVGELALVRQLARQFDARRFEQKAELLVDLLARVFKMKAETTVDERPAMLVEGEWNQLTQKASAKIDGPRAAGRAAFDLVRKSGQLVVDCHGKHPMHHETRLAQTGDNFYALESTTSRKAKPLFKLAAKISAKVFEPEHLFARRAARFQEDHADHLSVFEATLYEPKEMHIAGQFDCAQKAARMVVKCAQSGAVQETLVRFDEPSECFIISSKLTSPHEGQIYQAKASLSLPAMLQAAECMPKYTKRAFMAADKFATNQTCKSEIVYSDNKSAGIYAAQYYPGNQISVQTPRGKTTYNLAY